MFIVGSLGSAQWTVIIELFSLGVTAEALRVNTDWKAPFLK